ncbi:TOM7 family domain-containing protein [Ditylenchus destructor]|nr:TOM7 family domain-containing protein [Ditylenchus destructor]
MSKSTTRVRFAEKPTVHEVEESASKRRRPNEEDEEEFPTHAKKHTLDSDEEDDGDKYERLNVKNVEGQEEATDEYDGNTKIMAFNMKEDMEEGHFDSNGTFIFDKKENDNIDWDNVKKKAGTHWEQATDADDETEIDQSVDLVAIYKRLLELLTGKETIAAALKRMNSEKGLSAAEERKRRWAAKKAGTSVEDGNSKIVAEITSLGDALVSMGHMDAYQLEPTKIKDLLASLEAVKSDKPEAVDDSYDMFGDEPVLEGPSQSTADPDQVMWEYKLKSDDSKLIGPFTTVDMISKSESDALKEGAFVSERTKKVIEFSVETFRFGVQWGFVPFIVYLGFRRGAEPGPNGEIVPLSIANMFYG